MTRRTMSWAACLRILCAVGLLFVGFAHQPAAASGTGPLELVQYVLPDGTLPDLCLDDSAGSLAKHGGSVKCEACRIGGGVLMPEPARLVDRIPASRGVAALVLAEGVLHVKLERPGTPPRAPPFLSA